MKKVVVINMKDYIFADAVMQALRNDEGSNFKVEAVYSPEEIEQYSGIASVVLMEVTSYPTYMLEERLKTRDMLKAQNPNCKIVLVVDENSEKELADEVCRAKKDGLIDNFIYGSVSATYLSAVIDTL